MIKKISTKIIKTLQKIKDQGPILKSKKLWIIVVILLFSFGAYTLLAPFLPEIEYLFMPKPTWLSSDNAEISWVIDIVNKSDNIQDESGKISNIKPDKIIIPAISANVDLHYSNTENALNLGAWMKTSGAQPGQAGNAIITGHKFVYYSGERPFYHLYKVMPGNSVYIYWREQIYKYRVTENFVVDANETWIENPTTNALITVYTCEGLNAAQRRVIRAEFVQTINMNGFY